MLDCFSLGMQQGMGAVKGLFSFAENGSQNLMAGITNTLIDTSTELMTSVAGNAINSFDGNGFNQDRFNKGMNNVLLGSIGSLAKNTFKSINMLSTGAHWNGGLTYGVGKYTDEFAGKMMSDTNFFGGLIEQAVNNMTGVQTGFTFNILNTKDFGAKDGVGLLELSLGGDSASIRLGSGGLNVSYSGITDMLAAGGQREALKSAKQELQYAQDQYYDAMESGDQKKIARAKLKLEQADTHMTIYLQNNMAYGQITALEEKIAKETDPDKKKEYQDQLDDAKKQYANLNQALISGNYSSIVKFATQNQKVGSVAELGSDQIVDFSYDKNGNIVFDMNRMAVSATKLFHELGGHDGKNALTNQQSKAAQDFMQQFMNENKGATKVEVEAALKGKYGDEVSGEIMEEYNAYTFQNMLWGGLKEKYRVSDLQMDALAVAYLNGDYAALNHLNKFYVLGQNKQQANPNGLDQIQFSTAIYTDALSYYGNGQQTVFQRRQDHIGYMLDLRNSYQRAIGGVANVTASVLNADLQSYFGLNLIQGTNTAQSLVNDYNNLIESQIATNLSQNAKDSIFTSYKTANGIAAATQLTPAQQTAALTEYTQRYYGNTFNSVFTSLITNTNGQYAINNTTYTNLSIMLNGFSETVNGQTTNYNGIVQGIDTSRVEYTNSSMWLFESYHDTITGTMTANQQVEAELRRSTFMQYYMSQTTADLQDVARMMHGKSIIVNDGTSTTEGTNNGMSNTHFIANIDLLKDILTDMHNGTGGANGLTGNWNSFEWREGYRSRQDMINMGSTNFNSNHCYNNAVDILNVIVNRVNIFENDGNITNGFEGDSDAIAELFEDAFTSDNYNEFELKELGFHWGRNATSEPENGYLDTQKKVLWGNNTNDSDDIMRYWVNLYNPRITNYAPYGTQLATNGYYYIYNRIGTNNVNHWQTILDILRAIE